MRTATRTSVRTGALAALLCIAGGTHAAQAAFPVKPIRLIVGFAPGSINDAAARELARHMHTTLGQPFVVDNKPGAGGIIGTDFVAKATPDGYTLGLGASSQLVANIGMNRSLPFDIERDIAMVGLALKTEMAFIAAPDGPRTLKELIARAKADPKALTFGSAGVGSINHVSGEAFARHTGIQMTHVPYKGAALAALDVASNRIDLVITGIASAGPLLEQERVRVLAISGDKRSPLLPKVPTIAEAGVAGFEANTWNGLFASARIAPAIRAQLNAALNAALTDPVIVSFAHQNGAEIMGPATPADADRFAARERARWVPLIQSMNLAAQ